MLAMERETFAKVCYEPLIQGVSMPNSIERTECQVNINPNEVQPCNSKVSASRLEPENII